MKVLLLIGVVLLCFEFQLTSGGRGGGGGRGGAGGGSGTGGEGGETGTGRGSGRGGKKALRKRVDSLEETVNKLKAMVEDIIDSLQGLTAKEGTCPKVQPAIPTGPCPDECEYDIECPSDLKCCSNGCGGHACMKPGSTEKEGVCPVLPKVTVGICLQECGKDSDCEGDLLCCSNGCGHVCTKPGTTCNMPKDPGLCKAYFPRWYFNVATGTCEEFIYGGCGGNANNFDTRSDCENECVRAPSGPCPPDSYPSASYCGRGGDPCEGRYYCVNAPDDTYGVCCSIPDTGECPDGWPVATCFANPCEVSPECKAYPNAECTVSYCVGCNAIWKVDGKPVDCNQKGK